MSWVNYLMQWFDVGGFLASLFAILLAILGVSCAPNSEPMERAANTMVTEVVRPAIEKATQELGTRTAQLQGQGSLINPGYVVDGHGIFGTGVTYRFSIRMEGASANIAGATQADKGPDVLRAGSPTTLPAPLNP